jgi:uncharacterized protein (DUF2147 family)
MGSYILCITSMLILFSLGCSEDSLQKEQRLTGTFQSATNNYTLELVEQNDSIYGKHSFTLYQGRRIDYCQDKMSIKLSRTSKNEFTGTFYSCYDNKIHPLKVRSKNDSLLFQLNENHEFFEKGVDELFVRVNPPE